MQLMFKVRMGKSKFLQNNVSHLNICHIDLVRQIEPVTFLQSSVITVRCDSSLTAVGHQVLILAAEQQPGIVDLDCGHGSTRVTSVVTRYWGTEIIND